MSIDVGDDLRKLVSSDLAWHYRILPKEFDGRTLVLYVDKNAIESGEPILNQELELVLRKKVVFELAETRIVEEALSKYYLKKIQREKSTFSTQFDVSDRDFVANLIREARQLKSSDIHIEVYEEKCRLRFRIDGKLVERARLNKMEYPALINKVKIMAGLDISEKRLPQDGRIHFNRDAMKFDIRVSVLPTLYGEKIVLRILGGSASKVSLNDLGFSAVDLGRYQENIKKPNGIILISGPTGSGKSTTLYATLRYLNKESTNIMTIEDPIEYTLEGINQVQVKDDIGLTFSSALRTFLRQDPDIIMVGEIRDAETANLAIRAALTGHLVLSTIHTNSAWGTVSRLVEMGVPAFLLANTLNVTIAQRLIRLLCPVCKERQPLSVDIFPRNFRFKDALTEHHVHRGCDECFYTGYRGRRAIYELIPIDSDVANYILSESNSHEVSNYFRSLGVKTLQESAFDLVKTGETSVEEIYPLLLDEQF